MNLEEAKEFVRIHNIKGDIIHATEDGHVYVNADLELLKSSGVKFFQVFPEEKPSKKELKNSQKTE
jgi:hypothetical protein